MLGLTTPDSVSVHAMKQRGKSKDFTDCKFYGHSHDKAECQAFEKLVIIVVERITLNQNATPNPRVRVPMVDLQNVTTVVKLGKRLTLLNATMMTQMNLQVWQIRFSLSAITRMVVSH